MTIDDFIMRGEHVLVEILENGEFEGLSLDFKINRPGPEELFSAGRLTKHGRRVIGKAVSAFANSAGGLLVIGVDCRELDGVDQAINLVPIHDVDRAFSSLNSSIGELLQPRHGGLRVLKVPSTQLAGGGFLVIDVPQSDRRPHMSQADKHYYKRSGASSFAMEHYDIEDAFRRQTVPLLDLSWTVEQRLLSGRLCWLRVILIVENQGHSTAKFVTLTVSEHKGIPVVFGEGSPGALPSVRGRTVVSPPSDFVVHPSQALRIADLSIKLIKGERGTITIDGTLWNEATLDLIYELGAENTRPQRGRMLLSAEDFRPFVAKLDDLDDQ